VQVTSGTNDDLLSICFSGENGWAVGDDGVILNTVDGGASWSVLECPVSEDLVDVAISDHSDVWVVGRRGTILSASEIENNWQVQPSPTDRDLYGLSVSNGIGWIVGPYTLLRTSNGNDWIDNSSGTYPLRTLEEVLFVDDSNGLAIGYGGSILRTTDAGLSWDYQSLRRNSWLFDAHFINKDTGWLVGFVGFYPYNGLIVGTVDGGNNWTTYPSYDNVTFRSIVFVDSTDGWIVGSAEHETHHGAIYHTADGGHTWQKQDSTISELFDIEFGWFYYGWAVGKNGLIVRTIDKGVHWSSDGLDTTDIIDHNITLKSVTFVDERTGWVAGDDGMVYHTLDGGITWSKQATGTTHDLSDVLFIDEQTGWAVGGYGLILYTDNGGTNWMIQGGRTSRNLSCVTFINAYSGWIVGENGTILRTNLGGRWSAL
jgi:photosystem II stability/assembly factor-like uncharacterized protein